MGLLSSGGKSRTPNPPGWQSGMSTQGIVRISGVGGYLQFMLMIMPG